MNDYFLQIMKRIKIQRGYLAQNPYKRAKFYDQGFENVRNPPRTPHLQTYGKKYDLMKLLQVVTALMQLRKNEVNNSPVTYFKEGMKRNMERIKPAMRAAEQQFLGKTALDSLYKKTMSEIRDMLISRPTGAHGMNELKKLAKETDDERQEAYRTSGKYEIVAELVKDLVKQYKGKKELGLLASHLNDDLSTFKKDVIEHINKQKINDDEKAKQIFALEREIREFFNPENLDANASIADNSGLIALYPIMRKKALAVPSNISSATAILDGVKYDVGMDRREEAEQVFFFPEVQNRQLYMNLTGKTPELGDLLLTQEFLGKNPTFVDELKGANLQLELVTSSKGQTSPNDKSLKDQIKSRTKALEALRREFMDFMNQNKSSSALMMNDATPVTPIQSNRSNIPIAGQVLLSNPILPLLPSS